MSHEIEADFVADWHNEASQCKHCTSFHNDEGQCYCSEAKAQVPPDAHCDFFQSKD